MIRERASEQRQFRHYIVPTCAELPEIDVTFLDIPDPLMGEYGMRGIGEVVWAALLPR